MFLRKIEGDVFNTIAFFVGVEREVFIDIARLTLILERGVPGGCKTCILFVSVAYF